LQDLRQRVENELRSNILPFWLKHAIDEQYGGFRGGSPTTSPSIPSRTKGSS